MAKLFILLICYFIVMPSSGQIVNYEIDPTFSCGDIYRKGNIFNIQIHENESIIVNGVFHPSVPTSGWTIIGYNGNLIDNSSSLDYGANVVKPYLSKYITCGSTLSYRNANSSSDYSFRFEFQKPAYGGFISNSVNDVLVKDDSLLIVGGIFFTDSTDISTNSLRQLCMIDSTGAPIPDFPMVKCEPYNAIIGTINKLSTGEYIIGGRFSSVNEHPTNNIAKLHPDFSVDTSFVSPLGDDGTAFIQYVDSSNRLWLAVPGGYIESMPNIFPGLIRIMPDGSLDMSFNIPQIKRVINGLEVNAYSGAKIQDVDGTYIVGGVFTSYNGYEKHGLIKINDDGSLIPGAFENLGVDAATWGGYTSDYPGIGPIKKLPDGKLLLGGSFSSFGGEPYNCLVRLKPNGYVGVDKKEGGGKLKLYPNPAKSFIKIELPRGNEVINKLEIITVQGRVVKQVQNFSQNNEVSINGLLHGIYIVIARTDTGIFTQKLVIE